MKTLLVLTVLTLANTQAQAWPISCEELQGYARQYTVSVLISYAKRNHISREQQRAAYRCLRQAGLM